MEWTAILYLVIVLFAAFSRGPMLLYVFFGALSFGAMAAIPPVLLGGITLTPAWITAAMVAAKVIITPAMRAKAIGNLASPARMGLLTACVIYAVFSAAFLPRFFANDFNVYYMRGTVNLPLPLQPTSQNITQTLYFLLCATTVMAFPALVNAFGRRTVLKAILFGGWTAVGTGLLDMFSAMLGFKALLAPFRTATYALLVQDEVLNIKRVVGLMTEASAYSTLCMGFLSALYFFRLDFEDPRERCVIVPAAVAMLIVMIALSTSSTGYVGLFVFMTFAAMKWTLDLRKQSASSLVGPILTYTALLLGLMAMVWFPKLYELPVKMLDTMVFHKSSSSSYVGRMLWNKVSYQAFLASHGLGAGLGSARASSWLFAILANIGAIGALLLLGFIVVILSMPAPFDRDKAFAASGKVAVLPILAMNSLSGTSVSFGLTAAALFGIIGSAVWQRRSAPSRPQFRR